MHPNDEAAIAARAGIQYHRREIVALDAKIASLLGEVAILQKLKEEHQDQRRRFESVLTLARRLPPELLGQIFEHCVDVQASAPIILSQVCVSWRDAARSAPRIWSRLFIDCYRLGSAAKAAHWIAMSGDHVPLHIKLFPDGRSLRSVMDVLLQHAARWKGFTVDADLLSHASEILEIIRTSGRVFANMETLEFIVHEDGAASLNFREAFGSRTFPRLRSVALQTESWSRARLPSQITALNLVIPVMSLPSQMYSWTIELLRELPDLQSFSLDFPDAYPADTLEVLGDVMLLMPHLHTVILTGCYPLFETLAHLTLPALRHLCLRDTGKVVSGVPSAAPTLLRMIARSSPPVETLELHDVDLTDIDFSRCFIRLPTLEELFLHGSDISDVVFRRFCSPQPNEEAVHDSPPWVCPQLKRLDLRWCSQLSGKAIVELAEARLAAGLGPIAEVVLINCPSVRQEDILALADLTVCRLRNRTGDFCCKFGSLAHCCSFVISCGR